MRSFVITILAVSVLWGCGAPEPAGPRQLPKSTVETNAAVTTVPVPVDDGLKDIGDVEQEIYIVGNLDTRSLTPFVKEELMENLKGDKTMSTITVQPPYPPEFWLNFHVGARANYEKQPVALRVRIYRENEPIGEFTTKFGKYAALMRLPDGSAPPPNDYAFNVLQGLSSAPATLLVHAEATALLLPPGTDEATVDPGTATADEEHTATIMSNPVRINFTIGAAPQ